MTTESSTKLQSDGAEFLVLGHLLVRGLEAHKTYTGTRGHDIVVVQAGRACRVQVKARTWVDGDKGFPIKNFESEFVVNVRLNRGYEATDKLKAKAGKEIEFFVMPTEVVRAATVSGSWSKCMLTRIENVQQYANAWHLIEAHLSRGRD